MKASDVEIELERVSAELDELHKEIDQLLAAAERSAAKSDEPTWSNRNWLLSEWERWGIPVGKLAAPWTRARLGTCAACRHAHLTQGTVERWTPTEEANQVTAPEPAVTCLVTHQEIAGTVLVCSSCVELSGASRG